jgi:hypothetical protein
LYPGAQCSLQRVAGKEPEKEQKGPYTHYTFHLRKSGMAYRWRHPGSRNPHTSWEKTTR